jgi:hypothetical protein
MKNVLLICLMVLFYQLNIKAQEVYIDSNVGDDKNPGTKEAPFFSINKAAEIIKNCDSNICTIRLNPGLYVLDKHVLITVENEMTDKRIVIEASILPDDTSWTPEKMPVIVNKTKKGEIPINSNFVISFLVDASHVTIRGIKFHGYFYPNTRYFPIARFNKTKTDLLVEQCIFVGDANISQIQAGIIANGNEVRIDHCVFYKVRNTVVFFLDSGNGIKTGNSLTNSIIFGASQAVWTVSPDEDFIFKNNIVSNCRYIWVKNDSNPTKYSIDNCVLVNNHYYTGIADNIRLNPVEFKITENNVIKKGEISLRLTGTDDRPFLDEVDKPLPIDYMNIITGTLGYEMGAGIFKSRK